MYIGIPATNIFYVFSQNTSEALHTFAKIHREFASLQRRLDALAGPVVGSSSGRQIIPPLNLCDDLQCDELIHKLKNDEDYAKDLVRITMHVPGSYFIYPNICSLFAKLWVPSTFQIRSLVFNGGNTAEDMAMRSINFLID